MENVCEKVSYEFFKAGSTVFEHGSLGSKFFIIIDGAVAVFVPRNKNANDEFVKVAELSSGMAFGELALIKDQPRAALIKSITDCHFGVLNKEDYLRVIGKAEHQKLEEMISFLRSIPLFATLPRRKLERLTYFIEKKSFHRKQQLFKSKEQAKHVFIIKSGEFELTKAIKSSKSGLSLSAKIAILSSGEVIGEKEVCLNQTFPVSCFCLTFGEVFIIKAEHFLLTMDKGPSDVVFQRREKYSIREQRINHFEEMFNNFFDDVPKELTLKTDIVKNVLYKKTFKKEEKSSRNEEKVLKNKEKNYNLDEKFINTQEKYVKKENFIKIRPFSRIHMRAIKKRALVEKSSQNTESPSNIFTSDAQFSSYSPVSKVEKALTEMICHTPGGYYRGKLKRPRTRSSTIDSPL